MKNWSIDNKLWLCVLAPTFVSCAVLVAFFVSTYFQQLDRVALAQGRLITQNLVNQVIGKIDDNQALAPIFEQQLVDLDNLRSVQLLDAEQNIMLFHGTPLIDDGYAEADTALVQNPVIHYNNGASTSRFSAALTSTSGEPYSLVLIFNRNNLQVLKFRLAITLAIVGGVVLILAIIMFAILKRAVVRPFADLRDNLEQLSYGEIDKLKEEQHGQPFDLLSNYVKRIGELIHDSRKELQETVEQATSDLRQTLETVEEQNIELNIARKDALAANKAKSEFLANTSHEIRTPLNGILGFLHLLQNTELSQQQRDYLHNIEKSSQGLLTAINSIIDVSKLETGQLVLDYVPFNLREVAEDCIDIFRAAALEKHLNLNLHLNKATPVELLGDPLRLKQVLCNIIGNAIKLSNHGGIDIIINRAEDSNTNNSEKTLIAFKVVDQGKGIDPNQHQGLLRVFSQMDSRDNPDHGGTGLGFAVCKGIINLMQGDIGVETANESATTFWFNIKFGINQSALADKALTTNASVKPQFQANVLAVDDTPANLQVLSELLKDYGVSVSLANNGMEALGQCEQQHFDLIFMDIQMPVIDGMETTRRIRAMEQSTSRTPVVALTAHAMTDQKAELLLAGLDDYLSKPISSAQLLHILQRWLSDKMREAVVDTKTDSLAEPEKLIEIPEPPNNSPVDIKLGLELSNNKADLARDMLAMLLRDLPQQREAIVAAQTKNELDTLETIVHKIRGGASYCGTPLLKASSAYADELLRKKNHDKNAIEALLKDIDSLLVWAEEIDLDALFGLETVN